MLLGIFIYNYCVLFTIVFIIVYTCQYCADPLANFKTRKINTQGHREKVTEMPFPNKKDHTKGINHSLND